MVMVKHTIFLKWGKLAFLPFNDDDFQILTEGEDPVPTHVMWFDAAITWKCPKHGGHHHPARAIYMFSLN